LAVKGAGGATGAFLYDDARRIREIESIVGVKCYPGSLNVQIDESFDWDHNYLLAPILDVADRKLGLDSPWAPRFVRFYPCDIEGVPAFVFRFEGESYPDNFVEVISGWRLRNLVSGPITIEVKCGNN